MGRTGSVYVYVYVYALAGVLVGLVGSMVGSTVGHSRRGSGRAGRVGRAFGSSGAVAERLGNLSGCWCFGVLLRWWLVGRIGGSE